MKKTFVIFMALCLVLTMIPATAFAASVVKVSLSDDTVVYTGQNQPPTVTAVTVDNAVKDDWTSDIDSGENAYVNAGTYTITVTGEGNAYTGKATYTIEKIDLAKATFKLSEELTTADVEGETLKASGLNKISIEQGGEDITADCTITATVKGSVVTVKAELEASANVAKSSKSISYDIKSSIADAVISEIKAQTYTGKKIEPSVTVKTADGKTTLRKGTHYTVSYEDNIDAGSEATVIIEGIGSYTDSTSAQFTISQKDISSGMTILVSDAIYKNGNTVTPDVTVTWGSVELEEGTDFEVDCDDTEVGDAEAKIIGIGNFTGTVKKDFEIVDSDNALTMSNTWIKVGGSSSTYKVEYDGSEQKPSVKVYVGETEKDADLLSSSYYTVSYSDNEEPGTAMVIIKGKNGYAGTVYETFTITACKLDEDNTVISGYSSSYTYTGSYIKPEVTVKVNGTKLKENVDYEVDYENNRKISSKSSPAKIIITAIEGSGYTGEVEAEFYIAGKSIKDCTASFTNGRDYAAYTGRDITPSVRVKDGKTTLVEDEDYYITYKDAKGKLVTAMEDAGEYTVVINGTGAYSDEIELDFEVTGIDISDYTVTLDKTSAAANGLSQTPTVKSVKKGVTSSLGSSDYEVSYLDPSGEEVNRIVNPGVYKVVVTGKGGYSGSAYATFTVKGTPQEINIAKTAYKVYLDSEAFKITATATGDGTGFSYVSSDPDVASVDSKGVVTIHKLGRAKITVTTTGMKKSDPATDDVFVKVHPDKSLITKKPWTEGKTGSFRVRWNIQEDTTTYQVRYSTTSDFKSYKTKTVTASELYSTQSTRISGLKSNTKYYVKVRAVKSVYNDYGKELKYYGKWSNWRSVVTK